MKTKYEYFQGRFGCYIVEGTGIALMAGGASTLNLLPIFGGFALYIIGRDTSDRLVQEELRGEKSGLEGVLKPENTERFEEADKKRTPSPSVI